MRVMVMVPGDRNSEAGVLPDTKLLTEMGKFNEELVKAGVMLAAEGLKPTSQAKRVKFAGGTPTVIDGPALAAILTGILGLLAAYVVYGRFPQRQTQN